MGHVAAPDLPWRGTGSAHPGVWMGMWRSRTRPWGLGLRLLALSAPSRDTWRRRTLPRAESGSNETSLLRIGVSTSWRSNPHRRPTRSQGTRPNSTSKHFFKSHTWNNATSKAEYTNTQQGLPIIGYTLVHLTRYARLLAEGFVLPKSS